MDAVVEVECMNHENHGLRGKYIGIGLLSRSIKVVSVSEWQVLLALSSGSGIHAISGVFEPNGAIGFYYPREQKLILFDENSGNDLLSKDIHHIPLYIYYRESMGYTNYFASPTVVPIENSDLTEMRYIANIIVLCAVITKSSATTLESLLSNLSL